MEQGKKIEINQHVCTYDPEDNKFRLYPAYRLDKEDYNTVRAAGFRWAPKQELFVAPMWTPGREDLLLQMCGEIGDEDTSLVDRAEIRAERFEEYSEKRLNDANSAKAGVNAITKHIPMGQPILVGHHSEKRARKDAERIENGMRKAVKMWETSQYWEYRAKGALRHAKYKENPAVRARRIKKIEAAKRKQEKTIKESRVWLNLWLFPSILSMAKAKYICNYSHLYKKFTLEEYPREAPKSQYEGDMGLWGALDYGIITARQARNLHVPNLERNTAWATRWITHYNNRLIYEKAMLDDQGASDLLKPKARPKQLPLLNYLAPDGITVKNPQHCAMETTHFTQVEMTKAQYKEIPGCYKGCKQIKGTHRIKICAGHYARKVSPAIDEAVNKAKDETARFNIRHRYFAVFLTDSKVHEKPEPVEKKEPPPTMPKIRTQTYTPPKQTEFDQMKDTLRVGIKTVVAPQLFVTPPEIAEKMVDYLDVQDGMCTLEPSAGTGPLVKAVLDRVDTEVLAYEINMDLCSALRQKFPDYKCQVRQKDFLEVTDFNGCYPRIIMNPPFVNGSDIKHINHALTFLRPGGRLVALCANGPRQRAAFMDIAEHWEDLPEKSFKESGTNVNVTLMVLTN